MTPMRLLVGAAILLAVGTLHAQDATLLDRANAWQPGEPVPAELLHYQRIPCRCVPVVAENAAAVSDTTNDALLMAMLLAPCDRTMFDGAVDAAFVRLGASEFLRRLHERYLAHPELLAEGRHRRLHALTRQRHVTVDCLYIEDNALPSAERDGAFANITAELRAGAPFAAVLKKYSDAYPYEETYTRADGAKVALSLTHIGNNGDFVLTARNRRAINRSAEVPAAHARPLLAAKPGDVLVLHHPAEHRRDLYRVREVYDPPAP